jgi:hypothetical protein
MGTPRPTIEVDDLDLEERKWPNGVCRNYDDGARYCFRIGNIDYVLWKWPWPEWIGIPTHETSDRWLELIGYWKNTNAGKYDIDYMNKCVAAMLRYI